MKNLLTIIALSFFSATTLLLAEKIDSFHTKQFQKKAEVALPGIPESLVEEDDYYYVACIGQNLTPTEKDGDGFIAKVSKDGFFSGPKVVSANFFPDVKLNAPKGIICEDDVLYVADIDRVVGISIRTKKVVFELDFSKEKTVFLNDIVEDNDYLYVSATDINKIFKVSLKTKTYTEVKTTTVVNAPNGLVIEDGILYVAEYAAEKGMPLGKIKAISLREKDAEGKNPVAIIVDRNGIYDGLYEDDGFLYFSDWGKGFENGTVLRARIGLSSKAEPVFNGLLKSPADFIVEDKTLCIPVMVDKKILFYK